MTKPAAAAPAGRPGSVRLLRSTAAGAVAVLALAGCGIGEGYSDTDTADSQMSEPPATRVTEEPPTPPVTEEPPAEKRGFAQPSVEVARPKRGRRPASRTYLVSRVVDGDTIELASGASVRLVGIDTPERGQCGYDEATASMERLVLGRRVRLTTSDEDRDRYGRLLRYVDVGKVDAGLRQIAVGLAIARYDSRDGYGYHPRENRYIATDKATPDKACRSRRPPPPASARGAGAGCASGYDPCVPPYPPDVDCADVNGPVHVTGADPHGLDRDGDGVACE